MTEKQYSLVYYADKGGAFIRDNKNSIEWYHDSIIRKEEFYEKDIKNINGGVAFSTLFIFSGL